MQYTNTTGVMDLKSDLHKLIDEIQDEQLLQTLLNFLKYGKENPSGESSIHKNSSQNFSLSLPGKPISIDDFKSWVKYAEQSSSISLKEAKQRWENQRNQIQKDII